MTAGRGWGAGTGRADGAGGARWAGGAGRRLTVTAGVLVRPWRHLCDPSIPSVRAEDNRAAANGSYDSHRLRYGSAADTVV